MDVFRLFTKRNLSVNKTRTIVTVVGIILAVSMFTATTEAFVTIQKNLVEYAEINSGKYHVGFYDIQSEDFSVVTEDKRVEAFTYVQDVGYAEIGSSNEYKPYLFIGAIPGDYTEIMPMNMISGRLPENSNEIVVPLHLYSNGGVELRIGDTVELEVGQRVLADEASVEASAISVLNQNDPFTSAEDEILINTVKKTYTVVGTCYRPDEYSVEPYYAPGYTAFTLSDVANGNFATVFSVLEKPSECMEYNNETVSQLNVESMLNNDLLMFTFNRIDSAFNIMAVGLLIVLLVLIVLGSVALIYNAFSISVTERIRQFGILKSIGATKKQIKKTVFYEAVILCVIGIPLGLVTGCAGIAGTFWLLRDTISIFINDVSRFEVKFVFSPVVLILSSILGFVTVIISAYLPARRAIRINPIEAARQSREIKIRRHSVRVSPLTRNLFGIEGIISAKNFKRNRRKYRTTVFSLFVSVVLFISASSLAAYFTEIVETESNDMNYDVSVDIYNTYIYFDEELPFTATDEFRELLYDGIKNVKGIDEFTFFDKITKELETDKKYISDAYINMLSQNRFNESEIDSQHGLYVYNFIDDEAFRQLLKQEGLDEKDYFNKDNPKAILFDESVHIYQTDSREKVYVVPFLEKKQFPAVIEVKDTVTTIKENGEIYYYSGTEEKDGIVYYIYSPARDEGEIIDPSDNIYKAESEVVDYIKINVGAVLDKRPYYIRNNTNLIYPEYVRDSVECGGHRTIHAYIIAENHAEVTEEIKKIVNEIGGNLYEVGVNDYAAEYESIRALVTIAKVLAFGFIVLISLIAAANVFNTISTNISLRRREIATLKSVGLTRKGLWKMMFYESLLYGLKSLLFSLPVSFLMTCIIYFVITFSGYSIEFFVPWKNFIIAVISVFIIVITSMIYSILKLKRGNTVDTLRSENI